jgi:hypothetical protein
MHHEAVGINLAASFLYVSISSVGGKAATQAGKLFKPPVKSLPVFFVFAARMGGEVF